MIQTPKISRGGDFVFRVETRDKDNQPVEGISYLWVVDWVEVKGSRHKGKSFKEQSIRCKGGKGDGELRIYTYDEEGHVVEVKRTTFPVE